MDQARGRMARKEGNEHQPASGSLDLDAPHDLLGTIIAPLHQHVGTNRGDELQGGVLAGRVGRSSARPSARASAMPSRSSVTRTASIASFSTRCSPTRSASGPERSSCRWQAGLPVDSKSCNGRRGTVHSQTIGSATTLTPSPHAGVVRGIPLEVTLILVIAIFAINVAPARPVLDLFLPAGSRIPTSDA